MPRFKRRASNYRKLQMPYTRKEYIKRYLDVPEGCRKSCFGATNKQFPILMKLVSNKDGQVSAEALASIRVTIVRDLRSLGEDNYCVRMITYPHHIARSHGLIGVAKAERIAKGMKEAFGFPERRLAQIKKGQRIVEIGINNTEEAIKLAKQSLEKASKKLPPFDWRIVVIRNPESTHDKDSKNHL